MKIDDLIARADYLKKQDPLYLLRYDDGSTKQVSGHDAIVAACKSYSNACPHLISVEPIDGKESVACFAMAILHPVGR